jgi:hypothetical protein
VTGHFLYRGLRTGFLIRPLISEDRPLGARPGRYGGDGARSSTSRDSPAQGFREPLVHSGEITLVPGPGSCRPFAERLCHEFRR